MSRTISIAVLLAVIAPSFVIFTGLLQDSESSLPACCRRDGKHQCSMMDMAARNTASGETQIKALPPICPFRSQASSIPYVASYLPASSLAHFSGLQSHPAIHAQTFAALRVSETRSHQKRGPPFSVLT